ncbi:hypothetical protein MM1S1540310_3970 [Mycobacteroides abscessus subsp. bolletii 1S-154-0310]|uniref:DUF2637 domain-containing protein n=1 Tax=Mycobacteroides abscessus TaxID=36809 RepID=UPI0002681DCB|nr:DUF2637 domain-containing protein [Mycobacteroides abscessus]EIU64068.1 hypothetical protein MM1S1510930_4414 [Mycobacteroides abscessus subsp. bolletii 1S-151-0930]EIU67197.1 hypothetical protein MM1S1520914_4623 [Mycobacteroides abscessus subsp. bolletii 1S-152-0914]EIU71166.1 hypothetical protein MM1S1530915_3966 [Mycobacteroides abscessus subsp. bolletii 1S-153-0915]EIU81277.1 hypothetical protein MM1S1540310_3970 [Mycobacteroides abscessus subsp. bolletii 1S-154-0310]MBN7423264.1 DUF26
MTYAATLCTVTLVSLAGNVRHAMLTDNGVAGVWFTSVWFAVPPLLLPVAVHVAGLLARRNATTGSAWVHRVTVAGVAGVAAGTFAISFTAIRDLTLRMGAPAHVGALMPITLDVLAMLATVALLTERAAAAAPAVEISATTNCRRNEPRRSVLAGFDNPDLAAAEPPVVVDALSTTATVVDPTETTETTRSNNHRSVADTNRAVVTAVHSDTGEPSQQPMTTDGHHWSAAPTTTEVDEPVAGSTGANTAATATTTDNRCADNRSLAGVVVKTAALRATTDAVVAALDALAAGQTQTAAARAAGLDRSTIKRIIDTAEALRSAEKHRLSLVG